MSQQKTELAVAALRNGTVIDHIPCEAVYKAVRILRLEDAGTAVTIGNNLPRDRMGRKGIIKVADRFFDESDLDRIAIIAPTAVVNIIEDYKVVEKRQVQLPQTIKGIVHCSNPKCITNNEPMETCFEVVSTNPTRLRCRYCNRTIGGVEAEIAQ